MLKAAFPARFVDIRNYLMTDGLADAGITPTADDLAAIAAGNIPVSFHPSGSIHLTQAAYNLVGNYMARVISDDTITIADKPVTLGGSISRAEILGSGGVDYADPAIDTMFRHAVDVGEAIILRELANANMSTGSGIIRYAFFKARKTETISKGPDSLHRRSSQHTQSVHALPHRGLASRRVRQPGEWCAHR